MMRPIPEDMWLPVGWLLLAVGIGLVLAFFSIIRRIKRGPHEGPDHWRSHRRR